MTAYDERTPYFIRLCTSGTFIPCPVMVESEYKRTDRPSMTEGEIRAHLS